MYPIAMQFGIDPLHYGILVIASIGIGVFLRRSASPSSSPAPSPSSTSWNPPSIWPPNLVILFLGLLVITYIPWFTLILPHLFLR